MRIEYGIGHCFLGPVLVAATERGICAVELGDDQPALLARLREYFPKAELEKAGSDLAAMIQAVISCIDRPAGNSRLPLDIRGTVFQQRVWQALRRIKPGCTASYADIAEAIGSPQAARAVANACAANRIAVLIPCHRVIGKDGRLAGYRWGAERKQKLLTHEQER